MNENPQVIIEFVPDASKLDASLQNTMTELQATGKIGAEVAAQFSSAQNGVTESINKTTQASQNLGDSYKQVNANIAGGAIKEGIENINNFGSSTARITTQIRSMTNELIKMRLAGKEGTTEFLNLQNATAKLQREAIVARGSVRSLAEEFGSFKAAAEAIHGVNAAMQIATGSASLFGTENEKVQKEIQSLVGVMLIANGIQEATNLLQEKSVLRIKATAAWTAIATTATEFFAEASAAAWAAASAGITLAIAGIVILAKYLSDYEEKETARKDREEELTQLYKNQNEEIERQIKLKTALGESVSEDKINKETVAYKQASLAIEELDRKFQDYLSTYANIASASPGLIGLFQLIKGKLKDVTNAYTTEKQKQLEIQKNATTEQEVIGINAANKQFDIAYEQQKREIELMQNGFELKKQLFNLETEKQLAEQAKKLKEAGETEKQISDAQALLSNVRTKERTEMERQFKLSELQKTHEAVLAATIKNSEEELEAEIQLTKDKMKGAIETPGATDTDINAAKAQQAKEEYDLRQASIDKSIKQIQDYEKRYDQTIIDGYENRRIFEVKFSKEDLALFDLEQAEKLKQAQIGNKELQDKNSVFYKDFTAKQAQEREQFIEQGLKAQTEADNKAIDQIQKNRLKQIELQNRFNKSQADIDKRFAEERIKNPKENDSEVYTAIEQELAAKQKEAKEIEKIAIDTAKKISDSVFAIEKEARDAKYKAELEALQRTSDFELNNDKLTFAQKAAIKKKFDKEQAAIKLQQWNADKEAKETQAIINTALAVVSALATAPTIIAGIALAAAAAAAGAVEIATIASTKPPAFALGTPKGSPSTPAGMKLVGEHGPELITTAGGERIVPSAETAKILADYAIPAMPSFDGSGIALSELNQNAGIDYDKLGNVIAEKLKGVTQAHISIDKNGIQTMIVKGGSKHIFNNNKFSA